MQIKSTEKESAKKALITERDLHQAQATAATQTLSKNMLDAQMSISKVCVVSMDLQQVLYVPTLTHSKMFYSRQLSTYNLGIHIGHSGHSFMSMWHEGTASRGGNEKSHPVSILSCCNHLHQNAELKYGVIIAQVKIKTKWFSWRQSISLQRTKYYEIVIRFLISGYSYMLCDRNFGIIEKRKRVCAAMIPEELQTVVCTARLERPFDIVNMTKFYDFDRMADDYISTCRLGINSLSTIRISGPVVTTVETRETIHPLETWKNCDVLKKRSLILSLLTRDLEEYRLPGTRSIAAEKKSDLLAMLPFMERKYHDFYNSS